MEIKSTQLVGQLEQNLIERFYLYNMYLLDGKNRTRSEMSKTFENNYLNMALFDRERYGKSYDDLDRSKEKDRSLDKIQSEQQLKNSEHSSQNLITKFERAADQKKRTSIYDLSNENNQNQAINDGKPHWAKFRSIIEASRQDPDHPVEPQEIELLDNDANHQKDLMIQIAKSLAKVSSSRLMDHQKLTEKQDQRKVTWENDECVVIEVVMSMRSIANSSLQFCLWANKTTEEKGQHKIVFESKLIGEAYINVSTMFKEHSSEKYAEQSRVKTFDTKLWLHGICVGAIKGEIMVKTSPYLRQLVCGVLTEKGMGKNSSAFIKDEEEERKKLVYKESDKIKQINKLKDQLISSVYEHLGKKKNKSKKNQVTIPQLKSLLTNLKIELEKSDRQSATSFIYESKGELLVGQKAFIDVGRHLSDVLDEIDEELKELYFRNALIVLDRGELALANMGFSEKQKAFVKSKGTDNNSKSKSLKYRTKLALNYQRLLYECLVISLNILNQRVVSCDGRGCRSTSETSLSTTSHTPISGFLNST